MPLAPFHRFRRDRRGAVAIVFAISVLPLMLMTGVAIDYSLATRGRTEVASVADAAVVAAVSESIVKPSTPWGEQRKISLDTLRREFAAQINVLKLRGAVDKRNFEVTIEDSVVKAKICYEGRQTTAMLSMFGMASIPFSGCAEAQSAPPTYVKLFALIDASGSMGIGASVADQNLMRTKLGCEFACHTLTPEPSWGYKCDRPNWWNQTTDCVKKIGARTRYDVIREALTKVVDQAQVLARVPGQYQIGIYQFSNYLTEVHKTDSALPSVRNAIERMQQDRLGAGTNMRYVFPELARQLPPSGDGKSPDTPKVFVLLLSDGLEDNVYERPDCFFDARKSCAMFSGSWRADTNFQPFRSYHYQEVMSPRLCDAFKQKGATVLTLYTTNLRNGREWNPALKTAMRDCATGPQLGYSANSATEVDSAIRAMFAAVVEKARLVR